MKLAFWRTRGGDEIVCQQWVEIVTDYLEGTLPADLQASADRHLAACPHCREYLEQMRRTISLARGLRDDDVPSDVIDALARAYDDYYYGGPSAT
jgi:anti-sigma factor RsiW